MSCSDQGGGLIGTCHRGLISVAWRHSDVDRASSRYCPTGRLDLLGGSCRRGANPAGFWRVKWLES
jgi:hypothetical protein